MTTTGEATIHPRRGDADDADDDDDIATSTSSSSEAAGVARGAARTASAISRRQLVGRLPKSASKSTATGATATATATASRSSSTTASSSMMKTMRSSSSSGPGRGVGAGVLPKKVPVKHVAKVSDRISTGFDAYDATVSSSSSSSSSSLGITSTGSTTGTSGTNTSSATTTSTTTSNNVTAGGNATNNNVTTHNNNNNNNNAATGTSNDGGTSGSSSRKKIIMNITDGIPVEKWKSHVTNLSSVAKTMVKNTLLGTAVFGMYEETILYLDSRYNRQTENVMMGVSSSSSSSSNGATTTSTNTATDDDDTTTSSTTDAYKRTMVSQHFVAGLAAGSVHSILYLSFESMEYRLRQLYHPWWRSPFRPLNMNMMNSYNIMSNNSMSNHNLFPNVRSLSSWSFCHIFHHAIAHAFLFSTYEGTRRLLLSGNGNNYENYANVNNYKVSNNNNIINNNNNDENSLQHAFIIGLAGGFAGQMQHVVSHYTETLLRVGENDSPWTHSGRQKLSDFVFVIHDGKFWRINGPSMRSVLMAFPPSAIG
eukprot:CAMPEP_0176489990 /NCGR_PEP_ID=MMETSP0200_2-20121128/7610_1 /TAXON_ID=947934 /ORGANISM="Chaetoceros sp., Strain GSL56" /LENGTH=537 /DNA_ID=CAMNT_0017887223 /DNA_START=86 /DNA_END=1695 /DNA_ORIENTATION=+